MKQVGEAGDNVSFKSEAGNGTGRRGMRQCNFQMRGKQWHRQETMKKKSCKNLTKLIGNRTGHRPIMQEAVFVTDLRQVRHGTDRRV